MTKKLGLVETAELYDFILRLLTEMHAHKNDDGKIDKWEWLQVLVDSAPEMIKAVHGGDKIAAELDDLDPREIKLIANMGVDIMKSLLQFIAK